MTEITNANYSQKSIRYSIAAFKIDLPNTTRQVQTFIKKHCCDERNAADVHLGQPVIVNETRVSRVGAIGRPYRDWSDLFLDLPIAPEDVPLYDLLVPKVTANGGTILWNDQTHTKWSGITVDNDEWFNATPFIPARVFIKEIYDDLN